MNKTINKLRRQVMTWTAPTVVAVTLPTHAQMSPEPPALCSAPPIVSVAAAPKCAGDPPIGNAQLEILAPDSMAMELINIIVTTSDDESTLNDLPSLPVSLNDSTPVTVSWDGPASDALTCLPIARIGMILEYRCNDDAEIEMEMYNITDLLIDSVP